MKTNLMNWLAGLMVVLSLSAAPANAQEADKPLTADELGTRLEQLGFDYKAYKSTDGKKIMYYHVVVSEGGRNLKLYIDFSRDGKWIYVSAYANKAKNPKIPSMISQKILEVNTTIEPAAFGFYPKSARVLLRTPVLNMGGISNRVLRERLQHVGRLFVKYEDLHNPDKWPTAAPTPAPAPVAPGIPLDR